MSGPNFSDFFGSNNSNRFDPDDFFGKHKIKIFIIVALFFVVPNLVILVGAGQRAVIFNRVIGMEQRGTRRGDSVRNSDTSTSDYL